MAIHSRLNIHDLFSLVTCFLFLYQPFVDRGAVVQWCTDNIYGDTTNFVNWGVFSFHKVMEWGCIGFYTLMYTLEIPIFEKNRSFPHIPWPWNDPDPEIRTEHTRLQYRALYYILRFHAIVFCITLALSYLPKSEQDLAKYRAETVPHWTTSAWQILAGTVCAETGFYFAHRALHAFPYLYSHHKRHHEYKSCTVMATFYVEPLDALLTDLIPAGLPLVLFDMHIYTIWMYTVPLILNAVWVHCGYEMSLRFNPLLFLPFATDAEVTHDLHHRLGMCNYGGAYFIWDWLCGTYIPPPPLSPLLDKSQLNLAERTVEDTNYDPLEVLTEKSYYAIPASMTDTQAGATKSTTTKKAAGAAALVAEAETKGAGAWDASSPRRRSSRLSNK